VPFLAGGRFGAEVELRGCAGGVLHLDHRAQRGVVLIRLDLTARVRIVDGDRPEEPSGHGERDAQLVRLSPVEVRALIVAETQPVKRARAGRTREYPNYQIMS